MTDLSDDVLKGADAIASFLGFEPRSIYHAVSRGALPTFRVGQTVCARKSTITSWIEAQESAANDNAKAAA